MAIQSIQKAQLHLILISFIIRVNEDNENQEEVYQAKEDLYMKHYDDFW